MLETASHSGRPVEGGVEICPWLRFSREVFSGPRLHVSFRSKHGRARSASLHRRCHRYVCQTRFWRCYQLECMDASLHHCKCLPGFILREIFGLKLPFTSQVSGICVGMRSAIFNILSERIARNLRFDFMKSILEKDIEFFDSARTGDIGKSIVN